ncbi:ATP-binding protein [Sphingobacterium kyonggiense]
MKVFHLFIWMILFGFTSTYGAEPLRLPGANDIRIIPYLSEYIDCSCSENASEVLKKWKAGQFKKLSGATVVNKGVTDCVHWFALHVINDSKYRENYLWSFYNDGIKFNVFELDSLGNKIIRSTQGSHFQRLSERDVPIRPVSFEFPMEAAEEKVFLLRTEVFGRQNLYFPTDISTKSDILIYELGFSFLLGRYFGFFFFAIVFNLCLFLILKKRFYAMMLGYISSLLAFNMIEYLHDVYVIPDGLYAVWTQIPKLTFLALTLYFNVYVFMTFVQQKKYFPNLSKKLILLNKLVLSATLIYLLLHFALNSNTYLVRVFQLIFAALLLTQTAFLLVNIWYCIKGKSPYIFHYLLGNSLIFLSVVMYLLNTFDIFYFPQFVRPGNIIFAFSVEIIYLMIVFSVKYKQDFDHFVADLAFAENKRRMLALELVMIQEKERSRIAQDIHDGIGGTLQGLRLLLSAEQLQQKNKVQEMLKDINGDFKRLIHQLAPKNLKSLGLCGSIQHDALTYGSVPKIELQCFGDEKVMPFDMKIHLFRIYQELITNALKHAIGVTLIEVDLAIDDHEVRLLVQDNGQGVATCMPENGNGIGMHSIRSRVDYYRGTFDFYLTKSGCSAQVIIPFKTNVDKI